MSLCKHLRLVRVQVQSKYTWSTRSRYSFYNPKWYISHSCFSCNEILIFKLKTQHEPVLTFSVSSRTKLSCSCGHLRPWSLWLEERPTPTPSPSSQHPLKWRMEKQSPLMKQRWRGLCSTLPLVGERKRKKKWGSFQEAVVPFSIIMQLFLLCDKFIFY